MKSFILLFIALFSISNTFSQNKIDSSAINSQESIIYHFKNFEDLNTSYFGTTQNCQPYNVYSFKYKKFWILAIHENDKASIIVVNPPLRNKKINMPDDYLLEGIARCNHLKYTHFKSRRKTILDMQLYGFYKFNRFGRKVVRGLLLLQYPNYNKGLFSRKINEEKLQKKAEKEAEKATKEDAKKFFNLFPKKKIESTKAAIDEVLTAPKE